jgi:hypothetical protein
VSEMDPVTLGELSRRLDREFTDLKRAIEIQNLQYVLRDRYDAEMGVLRAEITEIKDGKKWLVRAMALAFVFPTVAWIVQALVAGP